MQMCNGAYGCPKQLLAGFTVPVSCVSINPEFRKLLFLVAVPDVETIGGL